MMNMNWRTLSIYESKYAGFGDKDRKKMDEKKNLTGVGAFFVGERMEY